MTGTASTLDGEPNLQFDGETLYQQAPGITIANVPLGGITSNINSVNLTDVGRYPGLPRFTGEVIYGENIGGAAITRGEICYWSYNGANFGFKATDINIIQSTFMLGLALEDIPGGSEGHFLLKGFVSVPANLLDLGSGGGSDGEPLYLQTTPNGSMSNAARWAGTAGTHYYRSIGYLVGQLVSISGATYHTIRFDPSTDYIL